ncbi:MAG: ABC transporter ATP-binding protein [Actinomycetes bacterium]
MSAQGQELQRQGLERLGLQLQAQVARSDFVLDVHIAQPRGRVLAIVGPNGSGKSSLLQVVAGLVSSAQGIVVVDGDTWMNEDTFTSAEKRSVGMVFQDYLLFPHLSVQENISFGLRSRGSSRAHARATTADWLGRFGIAHLAERKPRQLSGGQSQRVALVRALVTQPAVLLLDEPLAALDAQTRVSVRAEMRSHLSQFCGVTLLVTHDPIEAMVLADDICVLDQGSVVQRGTVADVTRHPATEYVAKLMGLNLVSGIATAGTVALDSGGQLVTTNSDLTGAVLATLRPSAIAVHRQPPQSSARNAWEGVIRDMEHLGDRVRLDMEARPSVVVDVTSQSVVELGLQPGQQVWLSVKATEIDVFKAHDEA